MAAVLLCLGHVLELVQGHEDLGDRGQFQMDLRPGGLSAPTPLSRALTIHINHSFSQFPKSSSSYTRAGNYATAAGGRYCPFLAVSSST
jgi:hypothetical protein